MQTLTEQIKELDRSQKIDLSAYISKLVLERKGRIERLPESLLAKIETLSDDALLQLVVTIATQIRKVG